LTTNGRPRAFSDYMTIPTIESTDAKRHAANVAKTLSDLVEYLRGDIARVEEPRLQALLETSAEVLLGLRKAYKDYAVGTEAVWRR